MYPPITTKYLQMRAEADEDSSAIDLTAGGGGWANRPSSNFMVLPRESYHENIKLIFSGGIDANTDPSNKTFSWKLYTWKDDDCPAEYVANGTGRLGTQNVVSLPDGTAKDTSGTNLRHWADTIAITTDAFVGVVDSIDAEGDNRVAKLRIQTRGYRYWYVEITSADGVTGTEAGAISVWYSRF